MPEGADQPAMQAQLDYGDMSLEQMRQRLVGVWLHHCEIQVAFLSLRRLMLVNRRLQ